MADENIVITNITNSDGSKKYYSSLDGVRYTNTNIGAAPGGVDIALGATGILIQTGTNNQPTQQNTTIYDNTFTNSVGDPLAPTTSYSTDLMTIAKLDSTIPAIQIAPSSTTLKINDTILVQNVGGDSNSIGGYNQTLSNGSSYNQIEINNDALQQWIKITDGSSGLFNEMTFQGVNLNNATFYKESEIDYKDATTFTIKDPNNLSTLSLFADSVNPNTGIVNINSSQISLNCIGQTLIGDPSISGNGTFIVLDDPNRVMNLNNAIGVTTIGDLNSVGNSTKIILDDGQHLVNTNAVMMTAYGFNYILPICYTYKYSGAFNKPNPNVWDMVRSDNINALPSEFYSVNNAFWDYKLEISLNLRNFTNPGDKGMALYIEFRDSVGNSYLPFLFNLNTPWTRYSNPSTYNNTASDMLTYTWTDYVNFNGIANNNPLEWRLWWYSDAALSSDFDMLISMTRTNVV